MNDESLMLYCALSSMQQGRGHTTTLIRGGQRALLRRRSGIHRLDFVIGANSCLLVVL